MRHVIDLTNFLPAGSKAVIGTHIVPFPGDPVHRNVGYDQTDSKVIRQQMDLMQDIGISFVTIDWYGTTTRSQKVVFGFIAEAERRGGFKVAVMADKGSDPQNLASVYTSSAYLDKLLLTFPAPWNGPTATGMKILNHGTGFLWMEIPKPLDTCISILKRQYLTNKITMGAVFSGFDDASLSDCTKSVWGGPSRKINDPQGANWIDSWRALPIDVPYVQLVTWNDYEEGTAFEGKLAPLCGLRVW